MSALPNPQSKGVLSDRCAAELSSVASQMKSAGLSDSFAKAAFKTALKFEGVADLLTLWRDETDQDERDEIVADIQELIDDCQHTEEVRTTLPLKMKDFDAIGCDIRRFKDNLLKEVNRKGGISHIAALTGIPQQSIVRFFISNAMPQCRTLLKIKRALNMRCG